MKPQRTWKTLNGNDPSLEATLLQASNCAGGYLLLIKLTSGLILSISRGTRSAGVTLISFRTENDLAAICRHLIKLGFSSEHTVREIANKTKAKEIAGLWHTNMNAALRAIVAFFKNEKMERIQFKHAKKTGGIVFMSRLSPMNDPKKKGREGD